MSCKLCTLYRRLHEDAFSKSVACFTNKIPDVHILGIHMPQEFWTNNAILEVCSSHCLTKLKPKSFVTGPSIGLECHHDTDSGGTCTSWIPY